ncbi:Der1-like family [Novymonas esmeraldas]|uniref:Derlin n=1 Tax=Novymonas esmeraldas TaxID=1808958 RepID=A0AAW0EXY8_9TRYP
MSQDFGEWFNQLGLVTRASLIASVGLSAACSLNLIGVGSVILTPEAVTSVQLWRFVTAAFYLGNFSFPWLMTVAMFVMYIKYNEENDFKGKTADMVYMFAVLIGVLSAVGLALHVYVTSFSLLMALCWVFCKRHPEQQLTLFGFAFRSAVFPWILMALHLIMGQGLMADVIGVAVGHAYIFFKDIFPVSHNQRWLETPAWLRRQFSQTTPRIASLGPESHPYDPRFQAARRGEAQPSGRHNWGRGQALGSG